MQVRRDALTTAAAMAAAALFALAPAARAQSCPSAQAVDVPGAEHQEQACLADLTTAGTTASGHTDVGDWEGLHARSTVNPSDVPGLQIDGYFPDTSTTNATHGWRHDAQFVIRLPDDWNGKLVVTGAPGTRKQYANDFVWADYVLDRGYAYASTDKGNTGTNFQSDGEQPADAVAEWHQRVREITLAAKQVVQQRYGRPPARTYIVGISNGGYLARWAIEHDPELYDGAVDWEGTLFLAEGPHILTYLPVALRHFPGYRATGSEADHRAMIEAGFEPGSEVLWDYHYAYYWDLTQRLYREELDPGYDGALNGGIPFCPSGTPGCDRDYDYFARPPEVRAAVGRVSLTGAIGKPMLTLHGTLDALLPIRTDSDVYARMVDAAGRGSLHRYYTIEAGNHVDGLYDIYGDATRPILPCAREAFLALERWVEQGAAPPDDQFVPRPGSGDVVNSCELAPAKASPPGDPGQRARPGRVRPRGLTAAARPRRDRRRPYRFTVTGRLVLPTEADPATACRDGRIRVQAKRGGATVALRRAGLRRDCTYRVRVRFRRRPGRRLALFVRFMGGSGATPMRAAVRYVRAG